MQTGRGDESALLKAHNSAIIAGALRVFCIHTYHDMMRLYALGIDDKPDKDSPDGRSREAKKMEEYLGSQGVEQASVGGASPGKTKKPSLKHGGSESGLKIGLGRKGSSTGSRSSLESCGESSGARSADGAGSPKRGSTPQIRNQASSDGIAKFSEAL